MTLKGIIFDLDGTLGNTLPIVVEALQDTFRRYDGREYTPEEIATMFGPTEEGVIERRVPPEAYRPALEHYLRRYEALHAAADRPFPGVIDLLEWLRARGVRTGIVTGKGPVTAQISLRAMGLEPYIEMVECGSPAGAEKPAGIARILAAWGLEPARNGAPPSAAYVGDVPYDMQAAREAGVLPIGAAWAATALVRPGDAEHVFDSVAALQAWLAGRRV